ncbi:Putative gustatory receptor 28b [Gryllus bimaculatus]|nr:Putative gustatory receptor 28b [Gryllus bimaculatus]
MTLSVSRVSSRPRYFVYLLHNVQTWLVELMFVNFVVAILLALRRLNREACVCDAAAAVNAAFSLAMLTSAVRSFVVLTSSLFLLLGKLLTSRRPREWALSAKMVPLHVMFCLEAAGRLVAVAAACTIAASQSKRTGIVIHKALIDIHDPDLRHELMSLQILHRHVQFTACDFFVIDSTLLYSIVGSVATYLVILLQFQFSSENTSVNNNQMSTRNPATSTFMPYKLQLTLPPVTYRNVSIFSSHN